MAFAYLLWFRLAAFRQTWPAQSETTKQALNEEVTPFYGLGRQALDGEHFTAAISFLEHGRLLAPEDFSTLFYLAEAYRGKGLIKQALAAYDEIIRLDNDEKSQYSLFALERSAQLFSRHEQLAEARSAYEKALARETRSDWLLKIKNQLAELDLTEGHPEDDGNYIYNDKGEVTGGVGPGDMRTNQNFEIARHTADWQKKEIYFKKAIKTDPGMHQAYFDVGLALTKQGRFSEAIPYFEQSNAVWQERTDINPGEKEKASAYAYLGLCHLQLGQPEDALALCDRAIALDSTYFKAHLFKARALLKINQAEAAITILRMLLRASPDDADVLAGLAVAYRQSGQPELARTANRQSRASSVETLDRD